MTSEQLNVVLAVWAFASPIVTLLLQKYFSRNKDSTEYSSDLLEIANASTEALKKARGEVTELEEQHEKTLSSIRDEHTAAFASMRSEYDGRINRLKSRVAELEQVQKIYRITFDLLTHPNVRVENMQARAVDNLTDTGKLKAANKVEG